MSDGPAYIRLDDGEYFTGEVKRIGDIDSLFPEVLPRAPSILVFITETNANQEIPVGWLLRFTFFNPTLMRQWSATPANVGELIRVEHHLHGAPRRWNYRIER